MLDSSLQSPWVVTPDRYPMALSPDFPIPFSSCSLQPWSSSLVLGPCALLPPFSRHGRFPSLVLLVSVVQGACASSLVSIAVCDVCPRNSYGSQVLSVCRLGIVSFAPWWILLVHCFLTVGCIRPRFFPFCFSLRRSNKIVETGKRSTTE